MKIQKIADEGFDNKNFSDILEALHNKYGGQLQTGPTGHTASLEISDEAFGSSWIQIYVVAFYNDIYVEKYYDSEFLQEEYGKRIKVSWTTKEDMVEKISSIIDEMKDARRKASIANNWDNLVKLAQADFGEEIGSVPSETISLKPPKPEPMKWDPYAGREKREEVEQTAEENLWSNVQATLERKQTQYGPLTFIVLRNTEMPLKDKLAELGFKAFHNRITNEWTWSKIINKYKSPDIDVAKLEDCKSQLSSLGVNTAILESAPVEISSAPATRGIAEQIDITQLDVPDEIFYWHSEFESARQLDPKERKKKYSDLIYNALEDVGKKIEQDSTQKQTQDIVKALLQAASNFHNYSFWNSLMIAIAKPGSTYVASENDWALMGRRLKQNAVRIPIMFPIKGKSLSDSEKETMSNQEISWATRTRFGIGSAIAYEDTEPISTDWISRRGKWKGKGPFEPPVWDVDSNEATTWLTKLYEAAYKWATEVKKFKIETSSMDVTGGWTTLGGKIAINDKYDGIRKVTTLFHEIAHQLIHFDADFKRENSSNQDRETDAEATAYVVASHYHIESKNTPLYLAGFGANKNSILARFNYVRRAAIEMFEGIDETMDIINQAKGKPEDKEMEPNEMPTADAIPAQTNVVASLDGKLGQSLEKLSGVKNKLIEALKKDAKSYVDNCSMTLYLNDIGNYTANPDEAANDQGIEASVSYRFYPAEKAIRNITPPSPDVVDVISVTRLDTNERIINYVEESLAQEIINREQNQKELYVGREAFAKTAYVNSAGRVDFDDINVRRLHGTLMDYEEWARNAKEEMEKWLDSEENIPYSEAVKRLNYYLDNLGLTQELAKIQDVRKRFAKKMTKIMNNKLSKSLVTSIRKEALIGPGFAEFLGSETWKEQFGEEKTTPITIDNVPITISLQLTGDEPVLTINHGKKMIGIYTPNKGFEIAYTKDLEKYMPHKEEIELEAKKIWNED